METNLVTTLTQDNGLSIESVLATVLYASLGVLLMVVFVMAMDKIFGFNVKKELIKDNNISVGVVIAGFAIAVAIIIAGTISS